MSENSLFAILLRSSYWVSFCVALVLVLTARFLLPSTILPFALPLAIPFVVIGCITAWRQLRQPSAARVEAILESLTAMSWREFSALMEEAFQRDGYEVKRASGAADFTLLKAQRTTLVSCKRWKAASQGLEPLRELEAARKAQGAQETIYVVAGSLTENARRFAADYGISLMQGPELARLLRHAKLPAKSAT